MNQEPFLGAPSLPLFDLDRGVPTVFDAPFEVCFSLPSTVATWRRCLEQRPARSFFIGRDTGHIHELWQQLSPTERELGEWVFPYGALTPSQIIGLGIEFHALRDRDLNDARIGIDVFPRAEVLQRCTLDTPDFSVIIPCHDKPQALKTTLEFWARQTDLKAEIIVIDDGSLDPWILSWRGQRQGHLTLVRLAQRPPGEGPHRFRAGHARNAGLVLARAAQITFADCDILVPPEFLTRVQAALQDTDLVMPHRWQLRSGFPNSAEIRFDHDVVLTPGAFWEDFQVSTTDWQTELHHWKWVSSFCLSVRRSLLERIGAFRPSFVTYGFEDSEWGYRAARAGARFQLLPLNVFHLPQSNAESQYGNDWEKRNQLFRISADRFFRHHPRADVYAALKPWLD